MVPSLSSFSNAIISCKLVAFLILCCSLCFSASVSFIRESFDGAALVKTLGRERVERDRFAAEAAELRDAKIILALRDWLLDSLIEAIPSATSLAMVVVGGLRVNSGDITIGTLVSFVNVFALLVVPVRTIGTVLGDVPRMLAGYARVRSVLDEPLPAAKPARDEDGAAFVAH